MVSPARTASVSLRRLSQGHLNALEACPRQFQHRFLDGLDALENSKQTERADWGRRFHRLVQQQQMGLPVAPVLAAEPDLARALGALADAAPDLFGPLPPDAARQSEHPRSLTRGGYLLSAVYDLLATREADPARPDGRSARIIDWKTYPRPREAASLARHWQTRLYLYLLVETGCYAPEATSMTYWFVPPPRDGGAGEPVAALRPESLTLAYDRDRHGQTERDLDALLARLDALLAAYARGEPLPQVPEDGSETSPCRRCPFARRCDRESARTRDGESDSPLETLRERLPAVAEVPEIAPPLT